MQDSLDDPTLLPWNAEGKARQFRELEDGGGFDISSIHDGNGSLCEIESCTSEHSKAGDFPLGDGNCANVESYASILLK
jgi:hypothetical protein